MLTVRDTLELPIFEQAAVVAGAAGLDNVIRWVHIVTMPDSSWYEWTKGGELVLTVGFGLRANEEKQQQLIQTLVDHRIVGLVLSVGHYFEKTPDTIIEEANRLNFPIIEVPGSLPFVEVTEAIFTRIVNEQYDLLQRAQAIHDSLMNVVLNGGTLQELAAALAKILDKSITIESTGFRVLASAERGDIDEARERTLEAGRTTPEIIQYLQNTGIQHRLIKDKTPIKLSPQPDFGLEIERIVAPILVAQSLLGYMWIIADDSKLTDLDTVAVEQAATVAALLLYKDRAVQESQRAMRGDFFSQLLQAENYSLTQLESQAEIFNFRLNRNYQVLVIESQNSSDNLANRVEDVLHTDTPALIVLREKRVVVVLQTHHQPQGKRIARTLYDYLSRSEGDYIVGIGTAIRHLNDIGKSYSQALEAVTIAKSLKQDMGVYPFHDLGLLHWLLQLPDSALEDNRFYRAVHDLDVRDRQLFETLEIFIEYGGSMKDAADSLFVHRNTLTYRLGRIEEITELDLRETHNQINLYVAFKAYRLRHNSASSGGL